MNGRLMLRRRLRRYAQEYRLNSRERKGMKIWCKRIAEMWADDAEYMPTERGQIEGLHEGQRLGWILRYADSDFWGCLRAAIIVEGIKIDKWKGGYTWVRI